MDKIEGEAEPTVGQLAVRDGERAGREPARERKAAAEQLDEISGAAEDQRRIDHVHRQRHADAEADMLLEAGRAGKALGRMDDLREAGAAGVETRPHLTPASATARQILGD